MFVYRLQITFISVEEAVKGALQGVFKGEPQGAIKEMIQGANQDALQHVLSRLFQGALKEPNSIFPLKHYQGQF